MKKTLDQMVRIKRVREEKADRAVNAQRRLLHEAETERDDAERTLNDYREHADTQERRIYRQLCERVVRLRDIEHVHDQVLAMRQQEHLHADELQDAEGRVLEEQEQLDADRDLHRQALRMRDKFIELALGAAHDERAEAERKEEAEIEEAAETRRPVQA